MAHKVISSLQPDFIGGILSRWFHPGWSSSKRTKEFATTRICVPTCVGETKPQAKATTSQEVEKDRVKLQMLAYAAYDWLIGYMGILKDTSIFPMVSFNIICLK
jgi:hypothetical protein